MLKPTLLSFALLLARGTRSAVVSETLNIVNTQLAPNGISRDTVVANGQFPGTLIKGNKNDNFQLNVVDQLTDDSMRQATSIHWHGLFQAHSNEMDGPAFINQCPIVPGESFLYDFTATDQAGTFWYHSHLSTQYCDGLRGPFVIYDPEDPLADMYDVDDETTVLSLGDWYNSPAPSLFSLPNPTLADPISNTTTINGAGRFAGGPAVALSVTNVTQGQRYRLRFINLSCGETFTVSIDNHNMTIIEADGIEHNPLTVNSFDIFPAQRYSAVIIADQPIDNYWIRVIPIVGNPESGDTEFADGVNAAILRYAGAADADPTSSDTNAGGIALVEANLSPLVNPGAPGDPVVGGVDFALNLVAGINLTTGAHTINGVQFQSPTVPVLLQILSGTTDPTQLLPSGSVYGLPGNSTIEISLPGGFPHPFHLHGHAFDIVKSAGQTDYNYVNPPRRDVVSIGADATDNVTFRFTTDNPGPWFLHCHIDWHLEAGLAIVFAEDTGNVPSADPPSDAWSQLCPVYSQQDPDTHFGGAGDR